MRIKKKNWSLIFHVWKVCGGLVSHYQKWIVEKSEALEEHTTNELKDILENAIANKDTNEDIIDINQLDSLLQTRHLIIHQDRFNQTENKIEEYINYLNEVVLFCDDYLNDKLSEYGISLEKKTYDSDLTNSNAHS